MAFSAPSGTNTFIPPSIAQELTIDYARNPRDFKLNQYVQWFPVVKVRGEYLKIDPAQNARALHTDLADSAWPDRQHRPSRPDNTPLFEWHEYSCQRFSEGYLYGDREGDNADFDLTKAYTRMVLQQAMTKITDNVLTQLATANFEDNTATAESLLGSSKYLDNGSADSPNFFDAILQARIAIEKATYGMIRGDDLILLMNPEAARKLAISPEIHAIRAESTLAQPLVTGRGTNADDTYGLPGALSRYDYVIENAVKNAKNKDASDQKGEYILPSDAVFLVSRPGGIEATDGSTAKSTLTLFTYQGSEEGENDYDGSGGFAIEEFREPKHRLTEGYVTWDFDPQLTTWRSAFKITDAFEPESSSSA